MNTAKSDAAKAAMLSAFVIPGAGQLFNRQWYKGIFILVVFLVASMACLIPITLAVVGYYLAIGQQDLIMAQEAIAPLSNLMWQLIILAVVSVFLYVYSIVDAYRTCLRLYGASN